MKQKPQLDPRAAQLLRLVRAELRKLARIPKEDSGRTYRSGLAFDQNQPGGRSCVLKKPTCESHACILGWMAYFRTKFWSKARKEGYVAQLTETLRAPSSDHKLLYLTKVQLERIYWPKYWPEDLQTQANWWSYTPQEAANRITRFLRTDGRE